MSTIFNENRLDLDETSSSSFSTNGPTQQQQKTGETEQMSIENEPFYFESDTLALRNNPDYSCILKTLILLEAQRIRACQDLEKLIDMKEMALRDPINFVTQLKHPSTIAKLDLPTRQKVYVLPEIDWNKYYDCVDLEDLENIRNQKLSRVQSLRQTTKLIQNQTEGESTNETSTRSLPRRSTSQNKPQEQQQPTNRNFNKPWTVEEQRYLEELLIEFPPEDNEAARWRRIATKLGTRTPLQVQSHCQKYFIKLAKAGLPVPGRVPNMKTYVNKRGTRGSRKSQLMREVCHGGRGAGGLNSRSNSKRMVGRGSSLNEISSMWTSFNPPITMNDELDDHGAGHFAGLDCEEENSKHFEDFVDEGQEQYEEEEANKMFEDCEEDSQSYENATSGYQDDMGSDSNNNNVMYDSLDQKNVNNNGYFVNANYSSLSFI
jgi:hypothetical protein